MSFPGRTSSGILSLEVLVAGSVSIRVLIVPI